MLHTEVTKQVSKNCPLVTERWWGEGRRMDGAGGRECFKGCLTSPTTGEGPIWMGEADGVTSEIVEGNGNISTCVWIWFLNHLQSWRQALIAWLHALFSLQAPFSSGGWLVLSVWPWPHCPSQCSVLAFCTELFFSPHAFTPEFLSGKTSNVLYQHNELISITQAEARESRIPASHPETQTTI